MSGTKAAVSGNNLGNGMQFRVIAYRVHPLQVREPMLLTEIIE